MGTPVPTQTGDILILRTAKTFSIYAIGPVSRDGQQDLQGQQTLKYVDGRDDAVAQAKALVARGRRIFIRNIDTGDWFEIAD